jgi:hypothetical protein
VALAQSFRTPNPARSTHERVAALRRDVRIVACTAGGNPLYAARMRALLRSGTAAACLLAVLAAPQLSAAAPLEARWHGTSWTAATLLQGQAKKGATVRASAPCAIGRCAVTTLADKRGRWKRYFEVVVPAGTTSVPVALSAAGVRKTATLTLRPPTAARPGNGTVMVIGDSLAVGTAAALQTQLPERRVTTQAVVGRSLLTGITIFGHTPLDSRIKVAVFSLFTNDDPANVAGLTAQVKATMTRLGSQRCAVWYTIRRPKLNGISYLKANEALHALAADPAYGGRLRIVPWYEAVAENHKLLVADRVHPTAAGVKLRAKLTAEAVEACPVL